MKTDVRPKPPKFLRAFSAGVAPAEKLDRVVQRVLSAEGIDSRGLTPKSIDVFLMPHAVLPDQVVFIGEALQIELPGSWEECRVEHWQNVAPEKSDGTSLSAVATSFKRIKRYVDMLTKPVESLAMRHTNPVA